MAERALTLSSVDNMKISELKLELEKRKASVTGSKAVLKYRLMSILLEENNGKENSDEDENSDEETNSDDEEKNSNEEKNNDKKEISDKEKNSVKNNKNKINKSEWSRGEESEEDSENESIHLYRRAYKGKRFLNKNKLSFRDVEDSLEKYSGDKTIPIEKWVKDMEDMAVVANWDEQELLVYSRKMLSGVAKQFIRSEKNIFKWKELKRKLISEFHITVNTRDVHDQLARRWKRKNETARQYLYEMMTIANQIDLEASSLIAYVIEGIQDSSSDKVILRGAQTMGEFKRKLDEYERVKTKSRWHFNHHEMFYKQKQVGAEELKKIENKKTTFKCYNCGGTGHTIRNCPRAAEGPKCFKCQSYGHLAKDCVNIIEIKSILPEKTSENSKMMITVKIDDFNVPALLDTGSAVNIIRRDVIEKCSSVIIESTDKKFAGVGGSLIKPSGKTQLQVEINGEKYKTYFYIVSTDMLSLKMIIGNELLEQAEIKVTPERIQFKKIVIGDICEEKINNELVKKQNGQYRVRIDNRKLNEKTMKDRFLIPNIEALQKVRELEGRVKQYEEKTGEVITKINEMKVKLNEKQEKIENLEREIKQVVHQNFELQKQIDSKPKDVINTEYQKVKEKIENKKQLPDKIFKLEEVEVKSQRKTKKQEKVVGIKKLSLDVQTKVTNRYNMGDIVAIQRTQFGVGIKLRRKFLGPYKVSKNLGKDRYEVVKIGISEGPKQTTSSADQMKLWRENSSETDE